MAVRLQVRLLALLLASLPCWGATHNNFRADFEACRNSSEVLKTGHMDLGVRIELTCPLIHLEVNHALDFWSTVIDMEWHDVQNSSCAIAIFDAPDDLVQDGIVGRSHLPEWGNFSGWIVLDPKMPITMSAKEIYSTAVHELGHMFGIHHSGDIKSVMYPFNCDGTEKLQPADLVEVAMRHKLRSNVFRPIKIRN